MRDDIDPEKPLVRLELFCDRPFTHSNGTAIGGRDYIGYRAVMKSGETRTFLMLNPGDASYDGLDVTEQMSANHFSIRGES